MISFDRLDTLLTPLEDRLEGFIQSVIADMSKALAEVTKVQSGLFAFARQREARKLTDAIAAKLARLTPYTEAELKRIFILAGIYSLSANAESIRRAGLAVPEIVESKALTGAVNAVFARTNAVLQNLTRTVAYQSQMQFVNAADDAFLQVTTGTLSIDQAVRQGVLNLAAQGVNVLNTLSGRTEQVDTAIMRNVRTAVNQATGDMTLALAAEMGTDYVEVSAHNGARNKGVGPMNHASWQGKVYSISGRDKRFKPFIETTGYGTPTGLLGINCRHSVFLAWPEHEKPEYTQKELDRINNTTVTYNGQKMDLYSATQEQRRIERGIREWKRKAVGLDAAGLDSSFEREKVREWQAKARNFTGQTGLERRYEWEQVSGYKRKLSSGSDFGGSQPPNKPPASASNQEDEYPKRIKDVSHLSLEEKVEAVRLLDDKKQVLILGDLPEIYKQNWPDYASDKWVLTGERKNHILEQHPEMLGLETQLVSMIEGYFDIHHNKNDKRIAVVYKLLETKRYLRAAFWISDNKDLMNSIHSFRFASEYEYLQGLKRSLIKKPR